MFITNAFKNTYNYIAAIRDDVSEFFEEKRVRKAWRQGRFYMKIRNVKISLEPLETYFALQQKGYDRFNEIVKNITNRSDFALNKNADGGSPIQEFHRVMREVFGVVSIIVNKKRGLSMLEMITLYVRFFSFIISLKKKHTGLQDFAPSLEARWNSLKETTAPTADSIEKNSLSDSTKTSSEQAEPRDSQAITEQPEPTTD